MANCEMLNEMSQLYTSVKQLTATTHELKQENTELREELKQLRTMLMRLNNIVDANSFELPSPKKPRSLNLANDEYGWYVHS